MRRQLSLVLLGIVLFTFSACGKNNIFSWAHSSGSGSSSASINSDAFSALQNKDYSKALEYYNKVLANDPNNSDAIYGFAVATLGEQGLDIATLITNLVKNQSSAPAKLAPSLASLTFSSPGSNLLPSTIIARASAIFAAINRILDASKLPKITKGHADGTIKPDDADVNVNIAFCLILRAALRLNDLVEFDTNYNATVKSNVSKADLNAAAIDSAKDISSAYYHINVVAGKLSSDKKTSLTDLNKNVKELYDQLKAAIAANPYNIDLSSIVFGQDYL